MTNKPDPAFYDRADALIDLANDQVTSIGRGKVSASTLYAASRFNAWVSACGCKSAEEMFAAREEIIEYYVKQYRLDLEENLDDYIKHFAKYMQVPKKE